MWGNITVCKKYFLVAKLRKNSELFLKKNNLQIKMFQPNIRSFELPLICVIEVFRYFYKFGFPNSENVSQELKEN